ncbi:hypothetical protein PAXRUDRAFT_836300 [Paxillus rubicundulus Ve08.2h10]|uniref:Uncharacterized protein n=1 Tax=Paxillus rubicundulus Ve08.2h10 TaxID=930991 RepID=A0A0D0D0B7_9AGAM|nr:hypothetical protein PAXRUDRAFT_836300 [Paxillus rubicundulus Ve08.2h10]
MHARGTCAVFRPQSPVVLPQNPILKSQSITPQPERTPCVFGRKGWQRPPDGPTHALLFNGLWRSSKPSNDQNLIAIPGRMRACSVHDLDIWEDLLVLTLS